MKKILLALLLLPFAVQADDTTGTWSAAAAGRLDSLDGYTWSPAKPGGFTGDVILYYDNTSDFGTTARGNVSVKRAISTSAYDGNWSISGYTLTAVDTVSLDGKGTQNIGNGITITGNKGLLHIGSGVGTVTASSCAITAGDGSGNDTITIDDDKSVLETPATKPKSLIVNGIVTNSGAGITYYTATTTPLIIGNNGSLTNNSIITFRVTTSAPFYSLPASYTMTGSGTYRFRPNGIGITATMPAITVTGTAGIEVGNGGGGTWECNMSGNWQTGNSSKIFIYNGSGANDTTKFDDKGYSITCGTSGAFSLFWVGINDVNEKVKYIFSGNHVIYGNFVNQYSLGTQIYNFGASTWNIKGIWTWSTGANVRVDPGTSTVTMNNAAKVTITTANKPFYNLTIAPTVTGTVDSFAVNAGCDSILGTLTLSTGKPKLMNKTYCGNYVNNLTTVGDTAFRSNWLFIGGNFTRAAGSIAKIDSPVVFQSGRDGITSTETDVTMNGCTGYQWYVRKLKTDIFKLMDNVTVNRFWLDSGIVIQNKKVLSDSIHVTLDSINADTTVVVWARDSIGAAARLSYAVNAEKQFLGTVDTTHVWSNSKQRIPIFENKTGGAVKYYDSVYTTRYVVKDGMVRAMAAIKATKFIDTANDTSAYLGKVYCDTFVLRYRAKKSFTGIYMRICTGVVDTTGAGVGTLPLYFPASTLSYASSPAQDTTKKAASHAITVTGCTMDSFALATALPAGLSLTKASGLISGTPTAATGQATYKVYGYKGASVDSCNFVLTVIALVSSRDKLGAFKAYRLGAYRNGAFRDPAYR